MTVVAAHAVPSDRRTGASGDWSDVVAQPSGDLTVVVGDVAGHGTSAQPPRDALLLAQHRLSLAGMSPAQVLSGLRRLTSSLDGVLATAACAVLSPDGFIELANAGHPPPLLIGGDGDIAFVTRNVDPPLGAPCPTLPTAWRAARLRAGDTLVLYTDGVVECHGRGIDEGLAVLAIVAGLSARAPVDVLCRRLAEINRPDDDLTVLAVRWDENPIAV